MPLTLKNLEEKLSLVSQDVNEESNFVKECEMQTRTPDRCIRDKKRVRNLGEVFTPKHIVDKMLDLVDHKAREIESRFLEPSCGTGNFLVEILSRKLNTVKEVSLQQKVFEFNTLIALSSIYGIDIDELNVLESRERMRDIVLDFLRKTGSISNFTPGYLETIDYILTKNIVCGDMLDGQHKIFFTEYSVSSDFTLKQRLFRLSDLSRKGLLKAAKPVPIAEIEAKRYYEIGQL